METQALWWRRTLAVPTRPQAAFGALRDGDRDDLEARQEPLLAVIILAGMGGITATPTWATLMDDSQVDGLLAVVLTFVAGGLYGVAGYWLLGGVVALALRSLGGDGDFRRARHLVGFAAVPLVLALPVTVVEALVYGADAFRTGGADEEGAGAVFDVLRGLTAVWALALLAVGIRRVERFPWLRVAGAFGLVLLFGAAFVSLATAL